MWKLGAPKDIYVGGRPTRRTSPVRRSPTTIYADAATSRVPRPLLLAIGAIIIAFLVFSLFTCSSQENLASDENADANAVAPEPTASVSFVAVGDNLIDETLSDYALACGTDGHYDFAPLYAPIRPLVEQADLSYICQETHLGGADLGIHGWPSFNSPDDLAGTLVDTGFDLVALASNHCYDFGNFGANEHSREVWNAQPVAVAGVAASEEEAAAIPVVEREGITFAFLSYTYGLNGFTPEDLPSYAVNFISEERLRADLPRARELADVVIVAMHWGTEKVDEPDEDQLAYAQLLADLGADIVLGSHPHVIQPVEWVEGADGHRTLVAYGLGDVKSNHDTPHLESELAGMLACDFVRETPEAAVTIENVRWIPLVNHIEEGAHAVYPLSDYAEELVARHVFLSQEENPLEWMRQHTEEVVNSRGANLPIE